MNDCIVRFQNDPQITRISADCKRDRGSEVKMIGEDVYIHPNALVEADDVGEGTRIWAFAHVLSGALIGRNCNIGDHCFVEGGVTIGDEVVVKNGVSIWEGVTIEDRIFVGPNVSFTNDRVPRAKVFRDEYDKLLVKEGASIGANATVVGPRVIGRFAVIGAGAVVVKDVPDFGLVYGNPARLKGWVCECGKRLVQRSEVRGQRTEVRSQKSEVRGQRSETGDERMECPACGISYIKDGPQISQINAD